MSPAAMALTLYVLSLALTFGARTWLMYRRTGSTGFNGLSGPVGSPGWVGGVLFILAIAAGLAAPVLQLAGVITPFAPLETTPVHIIGVTLAFLGLLATLTAQQAMGESWRIGVDQSQTTELVTTGAFALARNPIFTAMIIMASGLVLITPNPVALTALAALVVAIQLQVRAVEEPYLIATHGAAYQHYAARVGRYLPLIGRIR